MNPGRLVRNPVDHHDFHLFALAVGMLRISLLEASEDTGRWLLRVVKRRP